MRTNKSILILLFCFFTGTNSSLAGRLSLEDASNELSSEAAQCAAYYTIGIHCFSDRLDNSSKKLLENARDMSFSTASISGKFAGLSDEAILSRSYLIMEDLQKNMSGSCRNIPILIKKYSLSCQSLAEKPMDRLKTLISGGY